MTTRQLTEKQRIILGLIVANPGVKARDLCQASGLTQDSVQGTIVSLMTEGLVLRAYSQYPPCTYWPTQKGTET